MAVHKIPLPAGVSRGAIIGKGGDKIERMRIESKALIWIRFDRGTLSETVLIEGSAAAVAEAKQLVWQAIYDAALGIGESLAADLCCSTGHGDLGTCRVPMGRIPQQ